MPQSLRFDKASWRLENRRFSFSKGSLSVTALLSTNLGTTPLLGRGKVRDLYAVDGALLLVATDRISAFDFVLGLGIPGKGKILTQISLFWFDLLPGYCAESPDHCGGEQVFRRSYMRTGTSWSENRCW